MKVVIQQSMKGASGFEYSGYSNKSIFHMLKASSLCLSMSTFIGPFEASLRYSAAHPFTTSRFHLSETIIKVHRFLAKVFAPFSWPYLHKSLRSSPTQQILVSLFGFNYGEYEPATFKRLS